MRWYNVWATKLLLFHLFVRDKLFIGFPLIPGAFDKNIKFILTWKKNKKRWSHFGSDKNFLWGHCTRYFVLFKVKMRRCLASPHSWEFGKNKQRSINLLYTAHFMSTLITTLTNQSCLYYNNRHVDHMMKVEWFDDGAVDDNDGVMELASINHESWWIMMNYDESWWVMMNHDSWWYFWWKWYDVLVLLKP